MLKGIDEKGKKMLEDFKQFRKNGISLAATAISKSLQDKSLKKQTVSSIIRMIDGEPKNINPLKEIPESKMTLHGIQEIFTSKYFDTKDELEKYMENNGITNCERTCTIDYLGTIADRNDVIKVTYKNGNQTLFTAVDEDGYAIYNYERSFYRGENVWEFHYGDIKEMYAAFRDRGIIFENDIYAEIEERKKRFLDITQKVFCKKINKGQ